MNIFLKVFSANTDQIKEWGFDEFAEVCLAIAKIAHTLCEVDRSTIDKYGYASVFFMTDKFGGTYCNFIYDIAERKVYDWYGTDKQVEIKTWNELATHIGGRKRYMECVRNLDELADFINSQNED